MNTCVCAKLLQFATWEFLILSLKPQLSKDNCQGLQIRGLESWNASAKLTCKVNLPEFNSSNNTLIMSLFFIGKS